MARHRHAALRDGDRRAARPAPRSWACAPSPRCSSPTSSRARGTTWSRSPRSSAGAPAHRCRSCCGCPSGGGFSGGPFHSQNPESSFAHIPGLKCVCPATPEDAKGLMIAAIEDPNPVLFFEHKHLYRRIKAEVPDERYVTPIGKARIHQEGDDVTLVTWGAMVYTAEEAAKQLPDTSGRDHRPAHDHAVGQAGRPRLGAQDLQGARAARGHAHRRLRRRDRRDDRRGRRSKTWTRRSSASPRPTPPCRSRPCSRRHSSPRSTTSSVDSRSCREY